MSPKNGPKSRFSSISENGQKFRSGVNGKSFDPSFTTPFGFVSKHLEPNIIFGSKLPSFSVFSKVVKKEQKKVFQKSAQKRDEKILHGAALFGLFFSSNFPEKKIEKNVKNTTKCPKPQSRPKNFFAPPKHPTMNILRRDLLPNSSVEVQNQNVVKQPGLGIRQKNCVGRFAAGTILEFLVTTSNVYFPEILPQAESFLKNFVIVSGEKNMAAFSILKRTARNS